MRLHAVENVTDAVGEDGWRPPRAEPKGAQHGIGSGDGPVDGQRIKDVATNDVQAIVLDFQSSRVAHVRGYVVSEPGGSLHREVPGAARGAEGDDPCERCRAG